MSIDLEFLKSFQKESMSLVQELMKILESCETSFRYVKKLADYGQKVDRIMGGAKTLGLMTDEPEHILNKIGDYTALCKMLSYRAAEIEEDEKLYFLCVAVLLDATEALEQMFKLILVKPAVDFKQIVPQTLMERVKWIAAQIGQLGERNTKNKLGKMNQSEIDELVKKLGM